MKEIIRIHIISFSDEDEFVRIELAVEDVDYMWHYRIFKIQKTFFDEKDRPALILKEIER